MRAPMRDPRPGPGVYRPDDRTTSGQHGGAGILERSWQPVDARGDERMRGCGGQAVFMHGGGAWTRHLGKDLTRRAVGGIDTEPLSDRRHGPMFRTSPELFSGAWTVLGKCFGAWKPESHQPLFDLGRKVAGQPNQNPMLNLGEARSAPLKWAVVRAHSHHHRRQRLAIAGPIACVFL